MPNQTSKIEILYIDDDPMPRRLISFILEQHGFQAKTAHNGQAGVDQALAWLPHLILMDLMMPVMDGFQASQVLRTHPQTGQIPIVALSSANEAELQTRLQAAGMNGFISKTLSPPDLIAVLKLYLP